MCYYENNIVNQICMEMYLNILRVKKDSEPLREDAIAANLDNWGSIISKLEKIYPYAADKMDFMEFISILCSYIPYFNFKDSNIGVSDYINEVAVSIAETFLTFIDSMNTSLCKFEEKNSILMEDDYGWEEDD